MQGREAIGDAGGNRNRLPAMDLDSTPSVAFGDIPGERYRNHRGDGVAETLVFDGDRKIVEGIVTYL